MPRLNHRKARTGCQRCKARKVKCDEQKPRCSACIRHNVSCEYSPQENTNLPPHPSEPLTRGESPSFVPYATQSESNDSSLDPRLELRLMHEWTAYACESFSTSWQFWRLQAPLIALEFRYVLDALLALAALHASRQGPYQWIPMENRMVPLRHPLYDPALAGRDITDHRQLKGYEESLAHTVHRAGSNAFLAMKRSVEMVSVSRMYFNRAIDGHRKALEHLTVESIEAVYVCSILVSFNALFTLSECEEDSMLRSVDPIQWLRLAQGTRYLCKRWYEFVGSDWQATSGVFYGLPNLIDEEELFAVQHRAPFARLLRWLEDEEEISAEDREAYEHSLSYIGLVYKGIIDESDVPLATCRRLIGLPSRCPPRFVDLVEQQRPRALAILAYIFAVMRIISDKVAWFSGIAERQIPRIQAQLSEGWQEMMIWPLAVVRGEMGLQPAQTEIHDILEL